MPTYMLSCFLSQPMWLSVLRRYNVTFYWGGGGGGGGMNDDFKFHLVEWDKV
jgi:hypothetical protein